MNVKLLVYFSHALAHRVQRNRKLVGDLLVHQTICQMEQDRFFLVGELGFRVALNFKMADEFPGNDGGDGNTAGEDFFEGRDQLFARRLTFQEITARSGFERTENQTGIFRRRQDNEPGRQRRVSRSQPADTFDAIQTGQFDGHQSHSGFSLGKRWRASSAVA